MKFLLRFVNEGQAAKTFAKSRLVVVYWSWKDGYVDPLFSAETMVVNLVGYRFISDVLTNSRRLGIFMGVLLMLFVVCMICLG